jgi:hypothetical protein
MACRIDPRRDRGVVDAFRQNAIGQPRVLSALRGGPLAGGQLRVSPG